MAPKRTRSTVKQEEEDSKAALPVLVKSQSTESLKPKKRLLRNGSLSNLFKRKRSREDQKKNSLLAVVNQGDDYEDEDEEKAKKRAKILTKEQEEFLKLEKERDELLPEEYRKYRPRGYGFNLPPKDRPVRVYADGVFDLFHLGHMRQLEQCKKAFPNVTLICGIPSDVETHKRKGLTVLTDKQRCETLKHCRWVDEVIPDAPWIVDMNFLKKHKIDYTAHDDEPYGSVESDDIYKPVKQAGMFLATQRTEGISTSDIITKIIRDYDKYLMRNFERGATREELNVSWLKKNELDLKKQVNDFRGYFKKANENLNNASRDLYFEVREYLRKINKQRNRDRLTMSPDTEVVRFERGRSPASDFASKYIGNRNLGPTQSNSNRSFIDNFKEWMKKGGDLNLESSSGYEDDDDDNDDNDTKNESSDGDSKNDSISDIDSKEIKSNNTNDEETLHD